MKDKTDSMNRGFSAADAERGYMDPGSPPPTNAQHRRRMQQGALAGNDALKEYENPNGDADASGRGGFLKRNNYSDRF